VRGGKRKRGRRDREVSMAGRRPGVPLSKAPASQPQVSFEEISGIYKGFQKLAIEYGVRKLVEQRLINGTEKFAETAANEAAGLEYLEYRES
jgi:hypothetical protein